jgi:hypothetical protein
LPGEKFGDRGAHKRSDRAGVEWAIDVRNIILVSYGILIAWLIVGVWRLTRRRGRRVTPGPAALGSMDFLFDDNRRAAVEVIVEERTGEREAEDKDGNLPELERPTG